MLGMEKGKGGSCERHSSFLVARLRAELQQSIGDPGNTHSIPRNICGSAGTGEQETGIHMWFAVEREMSH